MDSRKGYIYRLTSPSGKSYIGQTIQDYELRWSAHRNAACHDVNEYAICKAIRKYGWDNFTRKVLCECEAWELNDLEIFCIEEENTLSPNGYNLTAGGGGCRTPCDETRKKMSASAKLRPPPPPFERKNGLDQNLPKNMQYVPGRNGYKIEDHPNCKAKAFYDSKIPLEVRKQECLDLLERLNNGYVIPDHPKRELPMYVHPVKNGYSIHIKNKTIKTFQRKTNTLEENLRLTIEYLEKYLKENKL